MDGLTRELVGFSEEVKPLVFKDPAHPQTTEKGSKQVTKSSVVKGAMYMVGSWVLAWALCLVLVETCCLTKLKTD